MIRRLASAVVALAIATPALAAPVTLQLRSDFFRVFDPVRAEALGLDLSRPARATATYDPTDEFAIDYSSFDPSLGGFTAATLFGPGRGLTVDIGGIVFTEDGDQCAGVSSCGLPYPLIVFRNGAFAGFDFSGTNADGVYLLMFPFRAGADGGPPVFAPGVFNLGVFSDDGDLVPVVGAQFVVPAPAAIALFGLAFAGVALRRRSNF